MKRTRTLPRSQSSSAAGDETKTLQEHLLELRGRLFWVVVIFLVGSAAAYPFFDTILATLVQPLGNQQLHYLTPAGGFSFILKVCMYVGIVAAIPMGIYQLFRYIQPIMSQVKERVIFGYIGASIVLASVGLLLAYHVSLPAALHFLTDFNLPQISAMITADSYFSFVMTYLLAAAVLFQLPLILLIINSVTPLDPGSMMKQQRFVIVIAFILGAIISPTPDALNQALLAGPIVIMYQLGIFLVMLRNWLVQRRQPKPRAEFAMKRPVSVQAEAASAPAAPATKQQPPVREMPRPRPMLSDFVAAPRQRQALTKVATIDSARPAVRAPRVTYTRSLDGFAIDA